MEKCNLNSSGKILTNMYTNSAPDIKGSKRTKQPIVVKWPPTLLVRHNDPELVGTRSEYGRTDSMATVFSRICHQQEDNRV